MENKSLGPVVSKDPALPPPPPATTKKQPIAKSSSTSSLSTTISGIKSMLNSEQNTMDKMKHINSETGCPVAPISADFSLSAPSVEGNLISVVNEKVKQLESTVQLQNSLLDKLSSKFEVETEKRIEIEKEMKKFMELVTRV